MATPQKANRKEKIRNGNSLVQELEALLNASPTEEELHQFIVRNPYLIAPLGGQLRFSKPSFGSEFRADFALANVGQYTIWTFVEIERPSHRLFTKAGLIAKGLNVAIAQVNSWWIWMLDHGAYAGAHYDDIAGGDHRAAIVIGRRASLSRIDVRRLQQLNASQLGGRLMIVTWDTLLEAVRPWSQAYLESTQRQWSLPPGRSQ